MKACLGLVLSLSVVIAGCGGSTDGSGSEDDSALRHSQTQTKTDEQVKAELEKAARGVQFGSETDAAYEWVTTKLDAPTTAIDEALVRAKLGRKVSTEDGPVAQQVAEERDFASFKAGVIECPPGNDRADCAKNAALMKALETNLTGLKVFYFGSNGTPGHVDGVSVTIFILGKTPQGNLGGFRTLAVWT